MRIAFLAYFVYLSILLISQDPARWIGTSGNIPEFLRMLMPIAHSISFAVLSFLTFSACLPIPKWGILFSLAIYGGVTELIQSAIPHRSLELMDWIQDLCGILLGFALFWIAVFFVRILRRYKNHTSELFLAARSLPD
jgi:VanZ family protein